MRRVSVILCSYNSLNYLKDTLLNIYEQDYKNIEVIVKDGGSNDGTQELLEKFEKKFEHDKKRLIWKSARDGGIYDAMNQGFQLSSGEVIVFFNDLFLKNNAISTMMKVLERHWEEYIGCHADWGRGK